MSSLSQQFRTRWPIGVGILLAFVAGFSLSFVSRKVTPVSEARIQVADFRIEIPEGETIVTITDRGPEAEELGRLAIERHGDTITGVPEIKREVVPREPLSADDAAFFRREIRDEVSLSLSPWERANRSRVALTFTNALRISVCSMEPTWRAIPLLDSQVDPSSSPTIGRCLVPSKP